MNQAQWLAQEDKYLEVLAQLEEQERWARTNGHNLLAKAYSEGSRDLLNELELLQKLRALDKS